MKIKVLFFASVRDIAGCKEADWDVPQGMRLEEFRRELVARLPKIQGLVRVLSVAVNAEYADDSMVLQPDDEVALIPPVSGGGSV